MSQRPRRRSSQPRSYVAGLLLAAISCACAVHPAGDANSDDCTAAADAADVGRCALAETERLQAELADEEARLVQALELHGAVETGTGQTLLEEFRRAQRAWLEYQEAECSYAYATAFGGELRGLHAATCLRDLLQQRLARVRAERERQER